METRIYRDYHKQLNAKTEHVFDRFNDEGKQMVLAIHSSKGGNGVVCRATVSWHDDSSSLHAMFQDFSEIIHKESAKRVTEKVLVEFHQFALDNLLEQTIKKVEAHYEVD